MSRDRKLDETISQTSIAVGGAFLGAAVTRLNPEAWLIWTGAGVLFVAGGALVIPRFFAHGRKNTPAHPAGERRVTSPPPGGHALVPAPSLPPDTETRSSLPAHSGPAPAA